MTKTLPTILLVDDDAATRYTMQRFLRKLPSRGRVLEAEDGEHALALVEAHCQECEAPRSLLVLLDLNMPVMDGLKLLEHQVRLPEVCRQVAAVIVVSSTPSEAERERARALAIDVKPKPLAAEQLAALVQQYLPTVVSANSARYRIALPTAYQLGYLAACAEQLRQVPAEEASGYPDRAGEWLAGYDDALGDNEQERARVLEWL